MSIFAAKEMRQALQDTAELSDSDGAASLAHNIPYDNRRDQNPVPFVSQKNTTDRWKL